MFNLKCALHNIQHVIGLRIERDRQPTVESGGYFQETTLILDTLEKNLADTHYIIVHTLSKSTTKQFFLYCFPRLLQYKSKQSSPFESNSPTAL